MSEQQLLYFVPLPREPGYRFPCCNCHYREDAERWRNTSLDVAQFCEFVYFCSEVGFYGIACHGGCWGNWTAENIVDCWKLVRSAALSYQQQGNNSKYNSVLLKMIVYAKNIATRLRSRIFCQIEGLNGNLRFEYQQRLLQIDGNASRWSFFHAQLKHTTQTYKGGVSEAHFVNLNRRMTK